MESLFVLSPLLFGMVIGWLIFYFVRQYEKFNASQLAQTAGVLIGGDVLIFLGFILSKTGNNTFHLWYILGVSFGFAFHLIYQWIVSMIYTKKFFNYRMRYQLMAGCNISEKEKEEYYLLSRKAVKLNTCFNNWQKNKITEEEFITYLRTSNISQDDYCRMTDENQIEIYLDDDVCTTIQAKEWQKYFK